MVDVTLLPSALAEHRPFAFAAYFRQQPLLQDGVINVTAELGKGNGLVCLEGFAAKVQHTLIEEGDLGFVFASSILAVGAKLAKDVAAASDLNRLAGVSLESCHILNKGPAVPFTLKEQQTQRMVRA